MASNTENACGYREAWRLNWRIWRICMRWRPGYFVSAALSAAGQALAPYVTIWLSARVIAELAGGRNPQQLAFWAALAVGLTAVMALANGLLKRWAKYEENALTVQKHKLLMDKMAALDYADSDRQEVQDLYSQIKQNDNWSGYGIHRAVQCYIEFCQAAVQVLAGVGFTLTLFFTNVPAHSPLAVLNSPLCMAGVLAAMVATVLASGAFGSRADLLLSQQAATMREGNRYFSFFGFMAIELPRAADLRIYRQQENVCSRYMRDHGFTPRSPIARLSRGRMGLLQGLSQALSALLTGVVYLYVCLKAWAGAFDVGAVTQYVGAATQLFGGISLALQTLSYIRANGVFLRLTFALLDLPNPMYQGSLTTEKRADRQYQVEFRDVSFRYPGSDAWALRHVNLTFRVGSRLAVVGPNGSGKTTFIKLLCRLYDPTEGVILLNGIDIRKYRYDDYIALFSVVFQDFRLPSLPLGENVAGAVTYDRDKAARCLADAGLTLPSDKLPQGLDTWLYKDMEEGVNLSGGEAQKVAIARALYKDAPFLILDEPTAALDPIAEAEIYEKFDAIAGDHTAVYISHRLSSCKFCDTIAVFDQGAILQFGSHADLVANTDGLYHRLWQAQAQYYTQPAE